MEAPIHASSEVDKNETWPRVIAVGAGIAILAIVGILVVNSGSWAPTTSAAPAHTAQAAQKTQ